MSRFPELYLDEAGIFHEYHYDEFISKSCVVYVANERNRLSKIKRPLLVQFRNLKGYATETRELDLDFVLKSVNSLAYHVDMSTEEGRATKAIIESFFRITPWPIPVEIFIDKQEALNWLKQFVTHE